MNGFEEHPFKVLMDYGHNAHAVGMMADLAQRLDVTGRRIVVLAGPGDRRDEDLLAIAAAVAGKFDHYIRSEEHTSELQSLMRISYAVLCLKKKKHKHTYTELSSQHHF